MILSSSLSSLWATIWSTSWPFVTILCLSSRTNHDDRVDMAGIFTNLTSCCNYRVFLCDGIKVNFHRIFKIGIMAIVILIKWENHYIKWLVAMILVSKKLVQFGMNRWCTKSCLPLNDCGKRMDCKETKELSSWGLNIQYNQRNCERSQRSSELLLKCQSEWCCATPHLSCSTRSTNGWCHWSWVGGLEGMSPFVSNHRLMCTDVLVSIQNSFTLFGTVSLKASAFKSIVYWFL